MSEHDCSILCSTELIAVLVTVMDHCPYIVTIDGGNVLPSGPLMVQHHSLQKGMQNWVYKQTGIKLGHTEQLYTFTDDLDTQSRPNVRISYMAILNTPHLENIEKHALYSYFPWEDRRTNFMFDTLKEAYQILMQWAGDQPNRQARVTNAFGSAHEPWNDELALERYELLWQVGLLPESRQRMSFTMPGLSMPHDHRRILATALSRLRSKIRYTPVIFDFLPKEFTLLQLQKTMETLTGRHVRKQNFRRLIMRQNLVKKTENYHRPSQGRPARLYKFSAQNTGICDLTAANLPLPPLT